MAQHTYLIKKISRRIKWLAHGCPECPSFLEMVWPELQLKSPPCINAIPSGYQLRQFDIKDKNKYFFLLESASIELCSLKYWENHILPNGFFVVENNSTGEIVASCMASHHPTKRHFRAGNLGWLAVNPKHRGQGLGYLVSAVVTAKLIKSGYSRLYLETQDFRYDAIKLYLKLGWVPFLYQKDMYSRWKNICDKILWPFTPDDWVN